MFLTNRNLRTLLTALSVVVIFVAWSGVARAQNWKPAPTFPGSGGGAGTALLLTDGTVMVAQSCNPNWYKLTPDNTGSYLTGSAIYTPATNAWAPLASPPLPNIGDSQSVVLPKKQWLVGHLDGTGIAQLGANPLGYGTRAIAIR